MGVIYDVIQNKEQALKIPITSGFLTSYQILWYIKRLRSGATAGVRGHIDKRDPEAGELNVGVAAFLAQAYSDYLKKFFGEEKWSVFVGFDTRHHSHTIAKVMYRVLAGNGIKVYKNVEPMPTPTPIITFLGRHLQAGGSIIITASHNPSDQNGIKSATFYGGQDTDDISENILFAIEDLYAEGKGYGEICFAKESDPLIITLDALDEYTKHLIKSYFSQSDIELMTAAIQKGWGYVIDGLGGTGGNVMRHILNALLAQVQWSESIKIINDKYDPEMLGIPFPDPSQPQVLMESGLIPTILEHKGITVGSTGDADWDRFGIATVIDKLEVAQARKYGLYVTELNGTWVLRFTANQIFTLIGYFRMLQVLSQDFKFDAFDDLLLDDFLTKNRHQLSNYLLLTTFPTSSITRRVADYFGMTFQLTSVGFKYLGKSVYDLFQGDQKQSAKPIIYLEESGGAQIGNMSGNPSALSHYDKDTSLITLALMMMSAKMYLKGQNLLQFYQKMASRLGALYYFERLDVYLKDAKGTLSDTLKEALARKVDELEKASSANIIAQLFNSKLHGEGNVITLPHATLFQKIYHVNGQRKVAWRTVYKEEGKPLPSEVEGNWEEIPVDVHSYPMDLGSFNVFHAGEGPKITLYDSQGREIFWILVRPSGTEPGLVRVYLEYIEYDIQNPQPLKLYDYAKQFLRYFGLDKNAEELEKRLSEKYGQSS